MDSDKDEPVDWKPLRELAKEMSRSAEYITEISEYNDKFQKAYDFAGSPFDGGMFLLGLTLNGLDLIPPGTLIEMKPYWLRAPISIDELWEAGSTVVPANL